MDKIWDRKSEVIARCDVDEKTEWPHRTDKSWTLKNKNFDVQTQIISHFVLALWELLTLNCTQALYYRRSTCWYMYSVIYFYEFT